MVKVVFKFDKERDLYNHWHKSNWKSSWSEIKVNSKIKEICENKKFEECKSDLETQFLKLYTSDFIPFNIKFVEKYWRKIEKDFFKRMNSLMKNKFEEDITAYLTTLGICPYSPEEPSFMFSLFYSLPHALKTCGHEIMHLYFHKFYWNEIELEIGKEKTADLKEALTVLLNLEFRDLWFVEDKGYEPHKKLRKFIEEKWIEENDFEKLIKKCLVYLKEKD